MSKSNLFLVIITIILSVVTFYIYENKYNLFQKKQIEDSIWNKPPVVEAPIEPQPTPEPKQEELGSQPKNYEEALKIAQRDNKNILLYLYKNNCPYCEKMKERTFSDPDVQENMNKFVVLFVNCDENPDILRKFQPKGVPAYYILNPTGEVLKSNLGFKSPITFNIWLKSNNENC